MKKSGFGIAALLSIAGLALSVVPTSSSANGAASTQIAAGQGADGLSDELSAQGRRGGGGGGARGGGGGRQGGAIGGGRQGGGNVGRIGRQGGGNVGRIGRQGANIGRVGRIGRYDGRVGRVGRIGRYEGRIGRIGFRYGGYRYGGFRYGGRIGYVPVPGPSYIAPGPGPAYIAPGPGISAPRAPCPVCPVQACLVAVYSEPNLTGNTVETADNQPRLDQSGWQDQISSIIVKSGTWDFYPDLEYRGQPLRLSAGSFPLLEPQWTKRIGSFMCVR